MKKLTVSILFLIIVFLFAGCGSSDIANNSWQVNLISYVLTEWVDSDIPGYGYPADDGYTWLLINLKIKNLTKEAQSINWLIDSFKYISADDNVYDLRLNYNDPPGYIDTYYNPGQEKEGFIAFEVPKNTNVTAGKLHWDPSSGQEIFFDLDDLPN